MESSRTHFEVLNLERPVLSLGLGASSPRKSCPSPRTAPFFESLKFCWKTPEISRKISKNLFLGDRLKNFFKTFFFGEHLSFVSLVLGLEHSCSWPREGLTSRSWFLALNFFVSLALALVPSLMFSTPSLPSIKPFKKLIFVRFIWGFPGGVVPSNYAQVFVSLIFRDTKKLQP